MLDPGDKGAAVGRGGWLIVGFDWPTWARTDEAQALWKQVSRSQGLSAMQPQIERVEIGSFGTFYALRIGPFPDKAESQKVCNALKRSGIDCSPAEQ